MKTPDNEVPKQIGMERLIVYLEDTRIPQIASIGFIGTHRIFVDVV